MELEGAQAVDHVCVVEEALDLLHEFGAVADVKAVRGEGVEGRGQLVARFAISTPGPWWQIRGEIAAAYFRCSSCVSHA